MKTCRKPVPQLRHTRMPNVFDTIMATAGNDGLQVQVGHTSTCLHFQSTRLHERERERC